MAREPRQHGHSIENNNDEARRPPLAVWPCGNGAGAEGFGSDPDVRVEAELARRLVAEYSPPGGTVVVLGGRHGTAVVQAAAMAREVFGVEVEPDRVRRAQQSWDKTLPAGRQCAPRLRVGDARHADDVWPELHSRANLVIIDLPRSAAGRGAHRSQRAAAHLRRLGADAYEHAMAEVLARAGTLTRSGGVAAVLLRRAADEEAVGHRIAQAVRAGQAAGLVYVQHVIALIVPVEGEALAAPLAGNPALGQRAAGAAGSLCRPAHHDVVVLTAPEPPEGSRSRSCPAPCGPDGARPCVQRRKAGARVASCEGAGVRR